jgi:hypothetical protein
MKVRDAVRVIDEHSEFRGRTGTVDDITLDGWVKVSLDDEAIQQSFTVQQLELT